MVNHMSHATLRGRTYYTNFTIIDSSRLIRRLYATKQDFDHYLLYWLQADFTGCSPIEKLTIYGKQHTDIKFNHQFNQGKYGLVVS